MDRAGFGGRGRKGAFVLMASAAGLAAASQASAQQVQWAKMPRMELQGQFAGPLLDTIIQRLRDPQSGTVCYLYLPITVQHSPPTQTGYVQYGPNTIGSISCYPEAAPGPAAARQDEKPAIPKPRPKK